MAGEITLSGKDYIMEVDVVTAITAARGAVYNPILCEVSSDFNIETDEQTVTNKCNGGWNSPNPNRSSFSFSGEFQAIDPDSGDPSAVSMNQIANLAATRQRFWLRRSLMDPATGVQIVREGVVWINSYTDTASTEDPFTFTADFTGVGEPLLTAATGG